MAAHRYWRVRNLLANGNPVAASEVVMRTVASGAQVCTGGTPISSSDYTGGYSKNFAYDGNFTDGHEWAAAGSGTNEWIGYDFGAGNEKDIVEIAYTARKNFGSQTPNWAAIEYSDDGSSWTLKRRIILGAFSNGETKTIDLTNTYAVGSNPHRYWRINVDNSWSNPSGWAELEFAATVGGDNLSRTAAFTPTISSNYRSGYPLQSAFDGVYPPNDNQFLFAGPNNEWMQLDFAKPTTIAEIRVWARQGAPTQFPAFGTIAYSDDGFTWTTDWEFSFHSPSAGEMQTAHKPVAGGHRAWRLVGVDPANGHSNDGMGLCGLAFLDSTGTAVGSPTLSTNYDYTTDGNWNLAEAVLPYTGGSVGWYTGGGSGTHFRDSWIACDYGTAVNPAFVQFCPLAGNVWTTGYSMDLQYTDDDPAGSPTWHHKIRLRGLSGHEGETRKYRFASVPALTPHRAWRVKVDSVGNGGRNCVVASEIEFMTDETGFALTYGKTGTAITNNDSNGARGNAFDDRFDTIWHDSCGYSGQSWIGWDSGADSANWFGAGCFAYTARDDGTYAPQDSIKTGGLEYTDDDPAGTPTWTRAYSLLNQTTFAAHERRVLPYVAPPTPDSDGHRYWRLLQYRNNTGQTGIAELEMAQSPGGPNLCTLVGGTASSDGSYGGFYGPDRAFNGDIGNGSGEWGVNGGGNSQHWLQFDFGAGNTYLIKEIRLCPFSDNGANPRVFAIQWSDDATTWETYWYGVYDGTYTFGQRHTFTRPTPGPTHRYLGFFTTKSVAEKYYGGAYLEKIDLVASEVEMAETVGGSNICVGGTPHWYSTGDAVTNVFDGNNSTEAYMSAGGNTHQAIWYDFGAGNETALAEIRYRRGTTYNGNDGRAPAEGEFIYSDDGKGWLIGNTFSDVTYVEDNNPTGRNIGQILIDASAAERPPARRHGVIVF